MLLLAVAVPVMVGLFPPSAPSPFGRLLSAAFERVPGAIAFRTTNKAGALVALAYALLLGLGAAELFRRGGEGERRWRGIMTAAVAVVLALAVLSLLAGDQDHDRTAMVLARRAAATADTQGLSAEPMCAIAYAALGRALARRGELAETEEQLRRALAPVGIESMAMQRAFALLQLAPVRRGQGDLPGARALVEQARELIERFPAPGSLPALLEQTEQSLAPPPRRRIEAAAPLSERELVVLRLLPPALNPGDQP